MSQFSVSSPTYQKARTSGKQLLTYIKCNNPREKDYPKQSLLLNYKALLDNNWNAEEETSMAMAVIQPLYVYLNVLNIPTGVKSWEAFEIVHKKENFDLDDLKGPIPHYALAMNFTHGVIVAYNSMSPYQAELLKDVKSPIIPDLSRWSDIAYLQWAEVCKSHGTEMSNLKYVIRHHVTNQITSQVIKEVLGKRGESLTPSGCVVSMGDGNGHGTALLGTPNGKGVAWLLAQHKETFKDMTIISVEIFSSKSRDPANKSPLFNLSFRIGQE
ncbi:hypothetical protein ACHAP3_000054 [Botrytis cinerea]